eukprot:XP_001694989.1 predicted protein [Chlamydomonas reinhardtii]
MGEAGAALLLGLVVGLIMKAAHVGHTLAESVEFRGEIFFYVLLPTIMFDAGYGLDAKVFLRNVGSVCSFAFLGTTISTFVVGLIMWGFGRQGWCYQMTLLENLTFGALISATDPVTVLAVFQRLGAQPDLYMNVFGESVLNDAVGLVLFQVITKFLEGKAVTGPNVMAGAGDITLFLGPQHYNVWSYTALCLIALAASRAANIYPLSLLCNLLRPIERRITQKEQFMMWWSGLRGAMAFALAVEASESYGEAGQVMKTVTFYLIFITVLWNGGSASYLLEGPDDPFAATAAIAIASPPPASTTAHGYAIPGRHVGGANGANGGRPLSASGAAGTGSMKRTGSLLQRLQSINDGHRILGGFDRVHSKLTKLLVHPRALHEHEAASPSALGHALAHAASAAPALSHAPSAPPPLSPAAGSAAAAAGGSPPPASGTGASGSSGSTSGGAALARQVSAPPVQLDGGPRSSGSPLGAAPAPAAAQPASLAPVHERASVPEDQ